MYSTIFPDYNPAATIFYPCKKGGKQYPSTLKIPATEVILCLRAMRMHLRPLQRFDPYYTKRFIFSIRSSNFIGFVRKSFTPGRKLLSSFREKRELVT